MRNLSKAVIALVVLAFVSVNTTQAQDITDADLKDYAIILLAQNSITDKISPMVNDLIEKQEGMTGKRFDELSKGQGEPAQEWETKFLAAVNKRVDKRKKAAKTVLNTLATNALGAAKFKAIRSKIKTDSDMKAKVDAIMASITSTQP